jgi:hypothetical protein
MVPPYDLVKTRSCKRLINPFPATTYLVVGPPQIDKHESLLVLAVLEQFQHFRAADGRWFRLGFGVCGVPWLFGGRRWDLGGHGGERELVRSSRCMDAGWMRVQPRGANEKWRQGESEDW